ncbi:hypothetical protein O181_061297 [Austropuccinia psidii MF-1]|uniref:Uncharacterized protein n=1 Tax=Austropuccinia psidii MF-1 TaxID=1389203 RepID=A0A9Q3EQ63_9BASI|nr:hypothetical protein [Austropuccinia psidii MF-1]
MPIHHSHPARHTLSQARAQAVLTPTPSARLDGTPAGVPGRVLNQLASHPSRICSHQDLMDITLEIDTRYHERQKEQVHFQEKKAEASKSKCSHPQNYSSPNQKKKKNSQKRDKPDSSLLNKDFKFMDSEK